MRTLWQVACVMILSGAALGQPDPSGIEFVTVGAPGNAPMTDPRTPPDNRMFGRGSVSYEYKIGKYETTSAQWAEFLNAYRGQSTPHPFWTWAGPVHSGMSGNQFSGYSTTPATAMFPLGGLTWRMSALYCNWLHNGKGSDPRISSHRGVRHFNMGEHQRSPVLHGRREPSAGRAVPGSRRWTSR